MRVVAIVLATGSLALAADERVVALRDEPHHVPKIENAMVRVLDLSLAPGEATLMHEHTADIATLVISGAETTNQLPGAEPTKVSPPTGRVSYFGYGSKAYTHRVVNVGTTPFRIIGVELFGRSGASAPSRAPPYELALENDRVRIWRVALDAGKSGPPIQGSMPCVRIGQAGVPEWLADCAAASPRNGGEVKLVVVDVEIK